MRRSSSTAATRSRCGRRSAAPARVTQAGTGHDHADRARTPTAGRRRSAPGRCRWAPAAPTGTLGTGAVVNNGALTINRSNALTVGNDISGTGTLTKSGTGTTTLTGDEHVQRHDDDQRGDVAGRQWRYDRHAGHRQRHEQRRLDDQSEQRTDTSARDISGTGTLTKTGTGTTTLTGTNTYSGTTTISAGTLQVGNGGTTGSLGTGNVTNNAALVVNRSGAVIVGGVISGTGTLTQAGTRDDDPCRQQHLQWGDDDRLGHVAGRQRRNDWSTGHRGSGQ